MNHSCSLTGLKMATQKNVDKKQSNFKSCSRQLKLTRKSIFLFELNDFISTQIKADVLEQTECLMCASLLLFIYVRPVYILYRINLQDTFEATHVIVYV